MRQGSPDVQKINQWTWVSADESGIDIGVDRQLKNLDNKGENRL